jgi:hypothetical protein
MTKRIKYNIDLFNNNINKKYVLYKMDNTVQLEKIKTRIEKLSKGNQIEILKILHTSPDVKLNENKSGVYVNLSFLPEKVYKKMITYLDYVQEQENMLSLTETKKDNYAKTFFEQDTQDTNEIVNTI